MKKSDIKRQTIIKLMADFILANSLQAASLRNLAEAAKTSDRMLLHYFKDKEEILTITLNFISNNLIEILENTRTKQMPINDLAPYLYQAIKSPQLKPYLRLWLELIAIAAKKENPFYTIARQICDSFWNWVNSTIYVDIEAEREQKSSIVMAIIEGFVILDSIDYDSRIVSALEGLYKLNSNKE